MKKTIIGFILLSGCTSVTDYPKQIIGTWKTIPPNKNGIQIQKTYKTTGVLETVSTTNPNEKYIANYKINGRILCTELISSPKPQNTKIGYTECVKIESLTKSKLVTRDDNNETATYIK